MKSMVKEGAMKLLHQADRTSFEREVKDQEVPSPTVTHSGRATQSRMVRPAPIMPA